MVSSIAKTGYFYIVLVVLTAIVPLDAVKASCDVGPDPCDTDALPYQLANGTQLRGARVSVFDVRIADRKLDSATIGFAAVRMASGTVRSPATIWWRAASSSS